MLTTFKMVAPTEPLFQLLTHSWFLYSFTALFTMANGQIMIINWICKRLDKKYDWETHFFKACMATLVRIPIPIIVSLLISRLFFPFDHLIMRPI